jgi:hypothetical protein
VLGTGRSRGWARERIDRSSGLRLAQRLPRGGIFCRRLRAGHAARREMLQLRSSIMLKLLEKNMVRGEIASDSVTVTLPSG